MTLAGRCVLDSDADASGQQFFHSDARLKGPCRNASHSRCKERRALFGLPVVLRPDQKA